MLTLDQFTLLCGERFGLQAEGIAPLSAELIEAEPLGSAMVNGRQPFSLVFAGPPAPVLPQQTYRLSHPRHPALDIFLVPVGADASAVQYQAIFS